MGSSTDLRFPIPGSEVPPVDSADRIVITDTNLSLVVKDVTDSLAKVESIATTFGGFMVNSNLNRPEGAANGTISIRVPSDNRAKALDQIRALGVKIVSENISGKDVTDQYEDIEAKLDTLRRTKAKFESILDNAVSVQDTLEVQRELVSLQAQIDALVGRQKFLEQSANLSLITIYLSTDELALPYTPDDAWRPSLVFKQAIRSMIRTIRGVGNLIIWAAAYAPIWIPAILLYLGIKKWRNRKTARPN